MSFNHKTIEELHDLLVSKEISATELTQATLDDIKARLLMKKELMQITLCQGFRSQSKTISQQMAS